MALSVSALLLMGCGTATDSRDTQIADITPSGDINVLEARSLDIIDDGKKIFYGECKYQDGQSAAMAVKIGTPDADFDVAIVYFAYLDGQTKSIFSAPSDRGDIFYSPNDQNIQLETIDINLNDEETGYTGKVDDGRSVYDCQVTLGLNAETYADLDAIGSQE